MGMRKRSDWLILQIRRHKYTIGAEIGCMDGKTTERLLMACPGLTMICVDLWRYEPEAYGKQDQLNDFSTWDFDQFNRMFNRRIAAYRDQVIKLVGLSWEMAKKVKDNSLDFVFIDADHAYESVVKDLAAWTPKLKPGGLLSGHDIDFPGVRKAVDEFTKNWVDTKVNQVWCCKKEDYGV